MARFVCSHSLDALRRSADNYFSKNYEIVKILETPDYCVGLWRPGVSSKNDPKSANVIRNFTISDSCKATFIALVEIFGKKIIKNSYLVRVYSPGT